MVSNHTTPFIVKDSMATGWVEYLLPVNEVWDKVIFLHLSVILFTRGRGVLGQIHPPGRYTPRQVPPRVGTLPPTDGLCAGGTHPTGMHSCCPYFCCKIFKDWISTMFILKKGSKDTRAYSCFVCGLWWMSILKWREILSGYNVHITNLSCIYALSELTPIRSYHITFLY